LQTWLREQGPSPLRHKSTIPRLLYVHCGGHDDSGALQRTKARDENELVPVGLDGGILE